MKAGDANDVLYAVHASHDYDPGPNLEKIQAQLLAINSADDLINPPELGILEREIKRVPQRPGDSDSNERQNAWPRQSHRRRVVERSSWCSCSRKRTKITSGSNEVGSGDTPNGETPMAIRNEQRAPIRLRSAQAVTRPTKHNIAHR